MLVFNVHLYWLVENAQIMYFSSCQFKNVNRWRNGWNLAHCYVPTSIKMINKYRLNKLFAERKLSIFDEIGTLPKITINIMVPIYFEQYHKQVFRSISWCLDCRECNHAFLHTVALIPWLKPLPCRAMNGQYLIELFQLNILAQWWDSRNI